MNQQQLQFERPRTRTRRTDPRSSARAEDQVRRSGVMGGQTLITANAVKQYPGMSSKQLSAVCSLDRYQLARRLSDLHNDSLVLQVQIGKRDVVWYSLKVICGRCGK